MALDQAKILFKKFIGGVSSTNNASPYFNEIAGASPANVTLNRLWMLSQRIPATNPFLPADPDGSTYGASVIPEAIDILEKVVVQLYRIQGTGGTTAAYGETVGSVEDAPVEPLANRRFKDIINSFVYGSDYAIEVRDSGGNIINVYSPQNDAYVDVDSGIISFYGNSIYNGTFITVTAYKYIGPKGDDPGLDIYDKLVNQIGGPGGGGSGSGIDLMSFKATRVGLGSLPAPGEAYNGLFYIQGDGNGGVNGDPVRFDVTFDYGNTWNYIEFGVSDEGKKILLIPTVGSLNNYRILEFASATNSFTTINPTRNQLVYVQSNTFEVFDATDTSIGNYTVIEDLYYQYIDGGSGSIFEPKSFEKTSSVELELEATNQTTEDGYPTGVVLPERNSSNVEFIELASHYTTVDDFSNILNKNSVKLYLNGQKIDLFDSNEEDPVFGGTNPVDLYNDFSAAFGKFTQSFDIIEGNEVGASANQFYIDLTAGTDISEQFIASGGETQLTLASPDPVLVSGLNPVLTVEINTVTQILGSDYTFDVGTSIITFLSPLTGGDVVDLVYSTDNSTDRFFGVITGFENRLLSNYKILEFPEDTNLIDYNEDYYDDLYDVNEGSTGYFFYVEITNGAGTHYRKVTDYGISGSSESIEFTYDGSDLSGTGLISVRLIYFKKPHRLTGGEELFWMPVKAAYEIEPGDEFNIVYQGDLEKTILVKNNLNNLA